MPATLKPLAKTLPLLLAAFLLTPTLRADDIIPQTWQTETLPNGLRVIYAPMPDAPTTHVRVIYHVGSRDESPDRQGFAHMFEHMMFRGSAHVAPEEHMKSIGLVGGYSNAFTSFDETVYVNTVPASCTELPLWLEADRMSSFKVSAPIFYTERLVVGQEWRQRVNQPYGTMFDELLADVFKVHPYRWTPIGNMQHLQAASAGELQTFFNKYYVPNNAILSIAGNIDMAKTKEEVHKYFGWIPGSATVLIQAGKTDLFPKMVERHIPTEPPQTEPRHFETNMRVPLNRIVIVYRMPRADSDDIDALNLMLGVLGDGRSSRLSRVLVTANDAKCVEADSVEESLEDGGVMGAEATLSDGQDPAAVEKILHDQIAAMRDNPVTPEELEKIKQQYRSELATRFETPEKVATLLGDEMRIRNNLDRVNTDRQRLEALTPADLQRVAKEYFQDNAATTLIIRPGAPSGPPRGAPATSPATAPATTVAARIVNFPPDYPTKAPATGKLPDPVFKKGELSLLGMMAERRTSNLLTMEDHHNPIVNWSITIRSGSYAEPAGKEGLGSMTAQMIRRGPKGKSFDQFNEELESRAISIEVADGGDYTRIAGSCLKADLPTALAATHDILTNPAFDPDEFKNLQSQTIDSLRLSLNDPQTVAGRTLTDALYGDSPLGRLTSIASLKSLTLDDIKQYYKSIYQSAGAIIMMDGDITPEESKAAAQQYFMPWANNTASPAPFDLKLPPPPDKRRVILVDNAAGAGSAIRIGIPAYSIASDEKYAGTLANQMLSAGIESRLMKYVRAEKGYVYGVQGIFSPSRQTGAFLGQTDTRFSATADTVEAIFKVLDDMKAAPVPDKELAEAQSRVHGGLLMSMETVRDVASRRLEGLLNGYPADYYDKYSQHLDQTTAAQIQAVMNKYVHEDKMIIVIVAPAESVKSQLERLGPVEVLPMPATD